MTRRFENGDIEAFNAALEAVRLQGDHYDIAQLGDQAGLAGWWTVLRNCAPVMHLPTEDAAREWMQERRDGLDLTWPALGRLG